MIIHCGSSTDDILDALERMKPFWASKREDLLLFPGIRVVDAMPLACGLVDSNTTLVLSKSHRHSSLAGQGVIDAKEPMTLHAVDHDQMMYLVDGIQNIDENNAVLVPSVKWISTLKPGQLCIAHDGSRQRLIHAIPLGFDLTSTLDTR